MSRNRRIDSEMHRCRRADAQSQVLLGHRFAGELFRDATCKAPVLDEHHDAARVLVQTMHDRRHG